MKRLILTVSGAIIGALTFATPVSAMVLPRITQPVRLAILIPPRAPETVISPPKVETVRAGDTLTGIAARDGSNWIALAARNGIGNPNLIMPGWKLIIPPASWKIPANIETALWAAIGVPSVSPSALAATAKSVVGSPVSPTQPPPSTPAASGGVWACIAQHESSNSNDNTGNGFYGYFQIEESTWQAYGGGPGIPSDYSYSAQLAVAVRIQSGSGWGAWPNTSIMCGV